MEVSIHTLARLLYTSVSAATDALNRDRLSKSEALRSGDIVRVAATLISPYMAAIGPMPAFDNLSLKVVRPSVSSPAYFTVLNERIRTSQIVLQNIAEIQRNMGVQLRMAGFPHFSDMELWIMMSIIFCHELVHAWVYYSCPVGGVENSCNNEAFATFVATHMSNEQGVGSLNQKGIEILGAINAALQMSGKLNRPADYYDRCYVKSSQTQRQNLFEMSCSALNGADIKYGGSRTRSRRRSKSKSKSRTRRVQRKKKANK